MLHVPSRAHLPQLASWLAKAIGLTAVAVVAIFAISPARYAGAAERYAGAAERNSSRYLPPPVIAKGAEVVHVGIEPIQFDGINLEDDSFDASFYIWWRWSGPIDPSSTTDIFNSTAASSNYVTAYSYTDKAGNETPTTLADGEKYQTAKISVGVSNPFTESRFPLDHQSLGIRIENNTYDNHDLVYVPDTKNMTVHPDFDVAGWKITGETLTGVLHEYGTNFGVIGQGAAASQYSQLVYNVAIDRPWSHFVVKLFLPMFVVLMAALAALFVKEDKFDVRLVMVGTGLLTLIFLQQGYTADLPETVPVVLMDQIYALAFVAVGVTFLRVIYDANRIHFHEDEGARFVRSDRWIATGIAIAFLVGSLILVLI